MEPNNESKLYIVSANRQCVTPFLPDGGLGETIGEDAAREIIDRANFECADLRPVYGNPDAGYWREGHLMWRCITKGTKGGFIVDGSSWPQEEAAYYGRLVEILEQKSEVKGLTILLT